MGGSTIARPSSDGRFLEPDFAAVRDAADRLQGIAVFTPLLHAEEFDELVGGARVLVKAECLQRTGSFKFRGAYNAISRLAAAGFGEVVAYSTGNHGQAVAAAARLLGVKATVVMPADAPRIKLEKARRQGADVVLYDRATESREDIAQALARDRGARVLPPGDDGDVIAGQGTAALEALNQAAGPVDAILTPCGGGGFLAGCGIVAAAVSPGTACWGVEPAAFDDTVRSLSVGERVHNAAGGITLCDALMAPTPAELPFAISKRLASRAVAVSEEAIQQAMRVAFEIFRLVLEPGGAAALAYLLENPVADPDMTIIAMASGGNVDAALFRAVLGQSDGVTRARAAETGPRSSSLRG